MNRRRLALLALLTALPLTACGSTHKLDASALAECLGSQTGGASNSPRDATFGQLATQARGFVKTFDFDSDSGDSFRDAAPTELYVLPDAAAAQRAQARVARLVRKPGQADVAERRGNLLLLFGGNPSRSQMEILDGCLDKQGAGHPGQRTVLWTAAKAADYKHRLAVKRAAELRAHPLEPYRLTVTSMVENCLLGGSGFPGRWFGTENKIDDYPLFQTDRTLAFDLRAWDPDLDQVPSNAKQLPPAPHIEIVPLHPKYDGISAPAYVRQAPQLAQVQNLEDPSDLHLQPILAKEGILVWDPRDHPPTRQQIQDVRDCYGIAAARFQQMLAGKRSQGDLGPN